jgi:hypothetical protein
VGHCGVIVGSLWSHCGVVVGSLWGRCGLFHVLVTTQVRFPPWSGIFSKLARCGYTLRVTSQASYSPEYNHTKKT